PATSIAPMDGGNGCLSAFSVLIGGASHVAPTFLSGDFLFWCLKRSGYQNAAVHVPVCFLFGNTFYSARAG
ncbi:hypothetical protein, partial [Candidatus Thiosymbion oneisti]|uniref:hypothetical protein n=1 Tax=Candidatus Thiosymbion oneisti TaxID=589554 RepID=UPI001C4058B3